MLTESGVVAVISCRSKDSLSQGSACPVISQNPFLLAILLFPIITALVIGVLIRKRQKAAAATNETDRFLAELTAKEKRLLAKMAELDKKLSDNAIQKAEYNTILAEYETTLAKVRIQLQEIKQLNEI